MLTRMGLLHVVAGRALGLCAVASTSLPGKNWPCIGASSLQLHDF